MHRSHRWIRRGIVLGLIVTAIVIAGRAAGPDNEFVPVIGGDTWPPVPVKDARPV